MTAQLTLHLHRPAHQVVHYPDSNVLTLELSALAYVTLTPPDKPPITLMREDTLAHLQTLYTALERAG